MVRLNVFAIIGLSAEWLPQDELWLNPEKENGHRPCEARCPRGFLSAVERYFLPRGGRGFSPSSRARNPGKKMVSGQLYRAVEAAGGQWARVEDRKNTGIWTELRGSEIRP